MKTKLMMQMALACVAVIVAMPGQVQAGVIIDNTGTDTGTVFAFGPSVTATFGQTLLNLGPDTQLESFSVFLRNRFAGSGSLDLRGYVAGWDGLKATSILYESSTQTMNAAGTLQEFAFAPGINLTAGNDYVFFLSISNLPGQSQSLFGMPRAGNTLNGGFVFQNNGTNFGSLTTNNWSSFGDEDVWLKAEFGAVPEPASLAIFGTICLVAFGRRRNS